MVTHMGLAAVGTLLPDPFGFNLVVSDFPARQRTLSSAAAISGGGASPQLYAATLNLTLLSQAEATD